METTQDLFGLLVSGEERGFGSGDAISGTARMANTLMAPIGARFADVGNTHDRIIKPSPQAEATRSHLGPKEIPDVHQHTATTGQKQDLTKLATIATLAGGTQSVLDSQKTIGNKATMRALGIS